MQSKTISILMACSVVRPGLGEPERNIRTGLPTSQIRTNAAVYHKQCVLLCNPCHTLFRLSSAQNNKQDNLCKSPNFPRPQHKVQMSYPSPHQKTGVNKKGLLTLPTPNNLCCAAWPGWKLERESRLPQDPS